MHVCPGWRTRDQLMALYNGNKNIVEQIIDRKLSMNEYKEHPDCPDDDAAILYYVMVDIDTVHEDETAERIEASMDMSANMGSEAGALQLCTHTHGHTPGS